MRPLLLPLLISLSCADNEAEQKCAAFSLVWCDSLAENCNLDVLNLSEEDCQELMEAPMDCANVVDVGENYDTCIDDLHDSSECLLDTDPPPSCEGVLLTE